MLALDIFPMSNIFNSYDPNGKEFSYRTLESLQIELFTGRVFRESHQSVYERPIHMILYLSGKS